MSQTRKQMLQGWSFNCTCSLCASPSATLVSDRNRHRIQEILEYLDHPENRTPPKIQASLDELVHLANEEGLAGQVGDLYSIIAEIWRDVGDLERAREAGMVAVSNLRHYAGYDNVRTGVTVGFLEGLRALERERGEGKDNVG